MSFVLQRYMTTKSKWLFYFT